MAGARTGEKNQKLASLPSVDRLLGDADAARLIDGHGRQHVAQSFREALGEARLRIAAGESAPGPAAIFATAAAALARKAAPLPRRCFNMSGTVLHTNLGRALLAEPAIAAMASAARHFTNIEFDLDTGGRGDRDSHVAGLLREITGAESVCLVNNNAAAVLLALNTLARGREVIVSRGELVEIGGSFRIPGIMKAAGAKLREAGTTNRTHAADYSSAIGPKTALLMKVHPSNYAIHGFTAAVPEREVAAIAAKAGLPFLDDLGSGTLIDLTRFGLPRERMVQDALRDGANLVTFSGDKLLGGAQAGFIAGDKALVQACAKNQLKRSLRLDKLRVAALEATLKLYRDPDRLAEVLPTFRFFSRTQAELMNLAQGLAPRLAAALGPGFLVSAQKTLSQIGSGAMPADRMPSACIAISPLARRKGAALDDVAARLRRLPIPVIGRIERDTLKLDLRCLDDVETFTCQFTSLKEPA